MIKDKFVDAPVDPRRSHSPSHLLKHNWSELIDEQRKLVSLFEGTFESYKLQRRSLEVQAEQERATIIANLRKGMDQLNDMFYMIAHRHRELTRRSLLGQVSTFRTSGASKVIPAVTQGEVNLSSVARNTPSAVSEGTTEAKANKVRRANKTRKAKFWSCFCF